MKGVNMLFLAIIVVVVSFITACEDKKVASLGDQQRALLKLQGTWVDTSYVPADVSHIFELTIDNNNFIYELTIYHPTIDSMSIDYWDHMKGTVSVNDDQLYLIPQEQIRWDGETKEETTVNVDSINVFEKYTYLVDEDKLTLFYTTYPADAPVNTSQTFTKRRDY